jgi:hypothetical protein
MFIAVKGISLKNDDRSIKKLTLPRIFAISMHYASVNHAKKYKMHPQAKK